MNSTMMNLMTNQNLSMVMLTIPLVSPAQVSAARTCHVVVASCLPFVLVDVELLLQLDAQELHTQLVLLSNAVDVPPARDHEQDV
jgi:hypothetical protein